MLNKIYYEKNKNKEYNIILCVLAIKFLLQQNN